MVRADAPFPEEDEPTTYETVVVPGETSPSPQAILSSDATCSNLVDADLMSNIRPHADEIVCMPHLSPCFEYQGIEFKGNATIVIME